MCIFKRNKLYKLDRKDLVNVICDLQQNEISTEEDIKSLSNRIKLLLEEAKVNKEERVFLVKKMANEIEERSIKIKRAMLILYNIKLSKILLNSIDDKLFIDKMTKINIFDCIKDQKKLAYFLNEALDSKIEYENILTDADDSYVEVQKLFKDNKKIYSIYTQTEDEIFAMLERFDEEDENVKNTEGVL